MGIGRVLPAPPETVYSGIKKAAQARATLERVRKRPAAVMVVVIAPDEAWTYQVCREGVGRRDFEVSQWDDAAFRRLQARLPKAARYRADKYGVHNWLPAKVKEILSGSLILLWLRQGWI